jgi:hypothetical protein
MYSWLLRATLARIGRENGGQEFCEGAFPALRAMKAAESTQRIDEVCRLGLSRNRRCTHSRTSVGIEQDNNQNGLQGLLVLSKVQTVALKRDAQSIPGPYLCQIDHSFKSFP